MMKKSMIVLIAILTMLMFIGVVFAVIYLPKKIRISQAPIVPIIAPPQPINP